MELLEDSLQRYAQQCEKTVLKYILKVNNYFNYYFFNYI